MSRWQVLLLIPLLLAGCSSHSPKVPEGTKLTLSGTPRQGFAPLRVTFHATLEGVDKQDAEFYCLRQEWDFGDGAISAEQPHCAPLSETTGVELEFFAEHVYEYFGNYSVQLTLGDKKIRSNRINILAIQERAR